MTTSPRRRPRAPESAVWPAAIPGSPGRARRAPPRGPGAVEDGDSTRQQVTGPAVTGPVPTTDDRGVRQRPEMGRANRPMATPLTAAVRSAVIGPASRIASGTSGRRIVEQDQAMDGGMPSAPFVPKPQSTSCRAGPLRLRRAQVGGRSRGRTSLHARMHAQLRRQLRARPVEPRGHRQVSAKSRGVPRSRKRIAARSVVRRVTGLASGRQRARPRELSVGGRSPRPPATVRPWPLRSATQSLENLKLERDRPPCRRPGRAREGRWRAAAFRTIASNERRHATSGPSKLREQGVAVPRPEPTRLRVRFIMAVARLFGTHAVSDLVQAPEGDEEEAYDAQSSPESPRSPPTSGQHAEIWKRWVLRGRWPTAVPRSSCPATGTACARRAGEDDGGYRAGRALASLQQIGHAAGRHLRRSDGW